MGGIRIQSNDDPLCTKITDVNTGEEIKGVVGVDVWCDLEKGLCAVLTVIPEEVDMVVNNLELESSERKPRKNSIKEDNHEPTS